ncbi:PhzF family phenazine biosynthesis protein [Sphingomonas kaistensis]|uniref:PhzF family phenazine biosynthesis protein n=1 Tax=Sphingomonas kaistensis TaxID=298708 RepID=A0A7X6BGN5_9SPHN|nr:PhzF family phenazine biosynthesis protein [Sphingomonas kaistensis]NJC05271.1 PhzF family phenazine biosynthesis protein [Sphingomonas kaistensis]
MTEPLSLPFFQVDAFTSGRPLTGNPAAVMPLDGWLPDEILQAIAAENNLSETAFTVPLDGAEADYHLRWFTPTVEVDLCGHATLASGHVLLKDERVRFQTRSDVLSVTRDDGLLWLDLPASRVREGEASEALEALGVDGEVRIGAGGNGAILVRLVDEAAVRAVRPDFARLAAIDALVMVTAPGTRSDIASRVFAAYHGIDEDPVTGSAHCALVPYWAAELGRTDFTAAQVGARGGELRCRLAGDRVQLGGQALTVIEGTFRL